MVAPALVTRPTRVFARITFTGEDKNLAPVCCDLSRVATIAAANPLPSNFGNTISREPNSKLHDPMLLQALEQSLAPSNFTLSEQNTSNSPAAEISVPTVVLNRNRKRPMATTEISSVPAKASKRHNDSVRNNGHGLNHLNLAMPVAQ